MTSGTRIWRYVCIAAALALCTTSVGCGAISDIFPQVKNLIPASQPTSQPSSTGPVRPAGRIDTSFPVLVSSQVVEPSGGSIEVRKPGDPLDGLELQVPTGAYPNMHQFSISYAPVTKHTFGEYFSPVTPLIIIENGGRYSDELMALRIPVDVPADHFAMAFYYDEVNGTLEGIPSVNQDADSLTIVTRHFSRLLVSIIKDTVLDDLVRDGIDSGFRPGGDDWQFTNRGSYIVPDGHCAGQSVSAMWYYCEKPDGDDAFLWGLYDRNGNDPATPDLWQDDSFGYRLASTVQQDIRWGKFEVDFQRALRGLDDRAHFKAFAYAIKLTGEPQYAGISSSAGGGHALIAYRVDRKGRAVADPNYPGATDRRIEYANGQFKPYNSGADADAIAAGNGKAFESIGYMAKTAMVEWPLMSSRWQEFKDGRIGNDRFPAYDIRVADPDGNEIPLTDGFESESEAIDISVSSAATSIGIRVFRDGTRIPESDDGTYQLTKGKNVLGIDVWGDVDTGSPSARWEYIDFQYIDVWYGPKETTGCRGWALESVTPDWAPKEKQWGDQYETDYVFSATDGAFSASGRKWIGREVQQSPWNTWVLFSHEGTWTPLPACVASGETTTITLNVGSPVLGIDGTPAYEGSWGPLNAYLWVNISDGDGIYLDDPGLIRASSTTLEGSTESQVVEFNLTELAYGNPDEGSVIEVAVWFGALNGEGCYRYKYVYHA